MPSRRPAARLHRGDEDGDVGHGGGAGPRARPTWRWAKALRSRREPAGRTGDRLSMDKAILTCALTGVLTDPEAAPVPVTPAQMAAEARDAFNAGASRHARAPARPGAGPGPFAELGSGRGRGGGECDPRRLPGVIINLTTGVIGPDISGPVGPHPPREAGDRGLQCRQPQLPQAQGRWQWAWPPMVFDNPVSQGAAVPGRDGRVRHAPGVRVLRRRHRALGGHVRRGRHADAGDGPARVNFVMGVASACPATPICWRCCRAG